MATSCGYVLGNYVVLSKKYRPVRLDDLIGQESLVSVLKNSIENKMVPNAFLFHGIRGVGKTTAARILARCLNCLGEDGNCHITATPCGKCQSCIALNTDSHLDVLEVDAASKTGVDDIRTIIDSAQYAPVLNRFRIFIIDEIHMLSKSAFNALLKTLEEPPAHVKFIFATTEVQKVPDTILSRCMTFNLRPISTDIIKSQIIKISKLEGFAIDDEAAINIAYEACGSVRDSLSILEQAMLASIKNKQISSQCVIEILGGTSKSDISVLLDFALQAKTRDTSEKILQILASGADPYVVYRNLQNELYEKIVNANNTSDKNLTKLLYLWQILLSNESMMRSSAAPNHVLYATVIMISHTMSFDEIEQFSQTTKTVQNIQLDIKQQTKPDKELIKKLIDNFPITSITEVE